jgi:c-di-AMP phosphodiesterase-like protein
MIKIDFSQSKAISILLPANPAIDLVASALALKLSLELANKQVTIHCPTPMTVDFNRLVGINTIGGALGDRNLVITFPGQTELVDKVSYNMDTGELQLVVVPKPDCTIDPSKLKIVSGTVVSDLNILMGISDLSELANTESLVNQKLIYFNHSLDPFASCLSEITSELIKSQNLPINSDIATNLMQGMTRATNGFTSNKVTKNTFDTASWLMENGARHQDEIQASSFPAGSIPTSSETPAVANPDPDWYEPKIYRGTSTS